jgi:hypothetical protein
MSVIAPCSFVTERGFATRYPNPLKILVVSGRLNYA